MKTYQIKGNGLHCKYLKPFMNICVLLLVRTSYTEIDPEHGIIRAIYYDRWNLKSNIVDLLLVITHKFMIC